MSGVGLAIVAVSGRDLVSYIVHIDDLPGGV